MTSQLLFLLKNADHEKKVDKTDKVITGSTGEYHGRKEF